MSRTAKKPRRKRRAAPRGNVSPPRRPPNPLQRLILTLGRTLVGVLPRSRRVRAANDPKA
ncbi:MAG: hypothetical protein KIS74_06680 [Burkholderiales bacterium]|nr:hypothetical protein [Burkholderiales bacterium]